MQELKNRKYKIMKIKYRFLLFLLASLLFFACHKQKTRPPEQGSAQDFIIVSPDGSHFIKKRNSEKFVVWGVNYDRDFNLRLLEDYWVAEWPTVVQHFKDMKAMGVNVVRIHLQLPRFIKSATSVNEENLSQLGKFVSLAESLELYLDITGLCGYRKEESPTWYDALEDSARWNVQTFFWKSVADVCKNSPAIFCYNLMNEPVASGAQNDDWYIGDPKVSVYYYVQRLTKTMRERSDFDVAKAWITQLSAAIRTVDPQHMITVGVIPWEPVFHNTGRFAFRDADVCQSLDFISVHYYPNKGKLAEDIGYLQLYKIGKPLVVEEIFPLNLGITIEETGDFMKESKGFVNGWMSFYWGKTATAYDKQNDFESQLMAAWLRYFASLKPLLTH